MGAALFARFLLGGLTGGAGDGGANVIVGVGVGVGVGGLKRFWRGRLEELWER